MGLWTGLTAIKTYDELRAHWWAPALKGSLSSSSIHLSWGLHTVLPQWQGTGFSQGQSLATKSSILILLFKWSYCAVYIKDRKRTSGLLISCLGYQLKCIPYPCAGPPQHQTFLHEIADSTSPWALGEGQLLRYLGGLPSTYDHVYICVCTSLHDE